MSRRSGLGRGLGALIPSDLTGGGEDDSLRELPLSAIEPNRYQPREQFDEAGLVALSESIRELGVLQPVLVRPIEGEPDRYELIAGERRWRASRKAGLSSIPAIIRRVSDTSSLEQAVVENLHRVDLNPLEEGAAYQQLMEDFGLTQEQLAGRVGKSRSAVANTMRLLQLPVSTQRLVAEGRLSAGHARALLGTPDRAFQDQLAQRVVAENLTVRQVEEAVRSAALRAAEGPAEVEVDLTETYSAPSSAVDDEARSERRPVSVSDRAPVAPAQPGRALPAAGLLELEQLLGDLFETNVRISMGRGRGRITIDFADVEDLERIYRVMVDEG